MGDFLYIFHSFLYSFVELLTLKGIIIKLTNINLNKNGTSITLQSIKNCLKNFQTEKIFGFSDLKDYETGRMYAYLAERYLPFWFKKYSNTRTWPIYFHDNNDLK